jgi:hypothetical protein
VFCYQFWCFVISFEVFNQFFPGSQSVLPVCNQNRKGKQAGAELCQAQEKLGLAKPALPVVVFHSL